MNELLSEVVLWPCVSVACSGGKLVDGGEATTVRRSTGRIKGMLVTTMPEAASTAVADEADDNSRVKDAFATVMRSNDVDLNSMTTRTEADCRLIVTSDALAPGIIEAKASFMAWMSAALRSETSPATISSAVTVYSVTVFSGDGGGDTCGGLREEPDGQLKFVASEAGLRDGRSIEGRSLDGRSLDGWSSDGRSLDGISPNDGSVDKGEAGGLGGPAGRGEG